MSISVVATLWPNNCRQDNCWVLLPTSPVPPCAITGNAMRNQRYNNNRVSKSGLNIPTVTNASFTLFKIELDPILDSLSSFTKNMKRQCEVPRDDETTDRGRWLDSKVGTPCRLLSLPMSMTIYVAVWVSLKSSWPIHFGNAFLIHVAPRTIKHMNWRTDGPTTVTVATTIDIIRTHYWYDFTTIDLPPSPRVRSIRRRHLPGTVVRRLGWCVGCWIFVCPLSRALGRAFFEFYIRNSTKNSIYGFQDRSYIRSEF